MKKPIIRIASLLLTVILAFSCYVPVEDYVVLSENSPKNVDTSAENQTFTCSFSTSKYWETIISPEDANWLSTEPSSGIVGSGRIHISLTANWGESSRTGTVKIVAGDAVETITVTQRNFN